MTEERSRLDPAFITQQKRRLIALQGRIKRVQHRQADEQTGVNADYGTQAREYEDDAQKLTALELSGNLEAADQEHLLNIQRALQKIEEGTYGLSEQSGKPIPIARLEAAPESLYTVEEQAVRDKR